MAGNKLFPVICVVVFAPQLIFAQHHQYPGRYRPNPTSSSWGIANEIYGSGNPSFRPPPGVLIVGQGPPVPRPRGPVQAGSRLIPFSTSTPVPSVWPSHGPQIHKAKEMSHFEYEVFPRTVSQTRPPPPPRVFRPAPPTRVNPPNPNLKQSPVRPNTPIPTMHPSPIPEILRLLAQDQSLADPIPTPRPQSKPDRPPVGRPAQPTPSPDFQEGFRILSDLFMENAGADLRNNLVGGSEISFNGNYYPIASINSKPRVNATAYRPASPNVEIASANEQSVLIPVETNLRPVAQRAPRPTSPPKMQQMQQSETSIAYGPPHYTPGRPQYSYSPGSAPPSHVSFMFSDPNEGYDPDSIYDGGYGGPPPSFLSGGNSIVPATPLLTEPQEIISDEPEFIPSVAQRETEMNILPMQDDNAQPEMPIMMMPITPAAGEVSNAQPPTSEEVQMALSVLARYASQQMGNSQNAPQMTMPKETAPSDSYGPPQMQMSMQREPSEAYGPPQQAPMEREPSEGVSNSVSQQQQSTPMPAFLPPNPSSEVTPPPLGAESTFTTSIMKSPSTFTTTEATDEAITVEARESEASSPFPAYGPPGLGLRASAPSDTNQMGWGSEGSGGNNEEGYGDNSGVGDSAGSGSGGSGGGITGVIGAKINAARTIGSAVTGGFKQIAGLKAGILNAGISAIGTLGKAKGDFAKSLRIPIVPQRQQAQAQGYGAPAAKNPPSSSYGTPPKMEQEGPVRALINGVRGVVGGVVGTVAQTGKAAVGIGVAQNQFLTNHIAIKGQAFTQTVSNLSDNKNQYFQNVLGHIQSIFDRNMQMSKPGNNGWGQR